MRVGGLSGGCDDLDGTFAGGKGAPVMPEEVCRSLEHLARVGGDDSWDHEFLILHPTCGERWINSRGTVERDAGGNALRLTGIILDITERKVGGTCCGIGTGRLGSVWQDGSARSGKANEIPLAG